MYKRFGSRVLYAGVGMIAGLLILHPYTMIVYALMHLHEAGAGLHLHWSDFALKDLLTFDSAMIPMATAFVLFGGVAGLLAALVIERKKKLLMLEVENERNRIAVETLRELMVTVSHHLLNANAIIGGKVRQCRRLVSDAKALEVLSHIETQGRKIDATIRSLREITEMKTADYTTGGTVTMIDIDEKIREKMSRADGVMS